MMNLREDITLLNHLREIVCQAVFHISLHTLEIERRERER